MNVVCEWRWGVRLTKTNKNWWTMQCIETVKPFWILHYRINLKFTELIYIAVQTPATRSVISHFFFFTKVLKTFESVTIDLFMNLPWKILPQRFFLDPFKVSQPKNYHLVNFWENYLAYKSAEIGRGLDYNRQKTQGPQDPRDQLFL